MVSESTVRISSYCHTVYAFSAMKWNSVSIMNFVNGMRGQIVF